MGNGDDRALGALYDAYGHVAYGLALSITGTQVTAESAVAEAFAEAWRLAASFDASRTSVLAWLTSIVRRCALSVRQKSGVGSDGTVRAVKSHVAGAHVAGARAADALRTLTAPQREAIELSYYRGFTIGEIAAHLGEPENGARELLRSAMQEIRATLSSSAAFEDHVVTRA